MEFRDSPLCCELCVDIVIPNYNGRQFLETCLKSIYGQTYTAFQIIIVDNGSSDGSVGYLHEHYPGVKVIALNENKGFSAAVNLGINTGENSLVFLLNNDTELAPDCLGELVRASEQYNNMSFAPKMLSFQDRHILDGAGDGFLRGGAGYRLGTMEVDSPIYGESRLVFGACAGAALYRRAMFEQIGLFDEDFFAYLEDVDLNFRANRVGFTCRYIPSARVYHVGSATTGSKINAFTVRQSTRNSLYLLLKNYPVSFMFRFFPAICIYQVCWLLFVIKKGQLAGYFSGLFGFFLGLANVLRKRRLVQRTAGIDKVELARRILEAERAVVNSIMQRRQAQGKGNWLLNVYSKLLL